MGWTNWVVIGLGVVVLLLGAVVVTGYVDARDRASAASEEGLLGSIDAIEIVVLWLTDAFALLIVNLFVTGIALVAVGFGLRRLDRLEREMRARSD